MDNGSPLVSVIILTYNSKRTVVKCLNSVLRSSSIPIQVIILDNGSKDSTLEILKKFESNNRVTIIVNRSNVGPASGRNLAINFATGKYLAFLDSDTLVDSSWLIQPVKIMEENRRVAAIQCNIKTSDGYPLSGWPQIIKLFGKISNKAIHPVAFAAGPAFLIRRSVVREISFNELFDSWFFKYYEEGDVSWRIRLRGYEILFAPDSKVIHLKGFFTRKTPTEEFHMYKNLLAMIFKYYDILHILVTVPQIIGYQLIRTVILRLKPTIFLRAHLAVLKQMRQVIKWRLFINNIRKQQDKSILHDLRVQTFNVLIMYRIYRIARSVQQLRICSQMNSCLK